VIGDQVNATNIVLALTTDVSKVAHFGGMYTLRRDRRRHRHRLAKRRRVLPHPRIGLDDMEWTNAITPATGGNPDWVSVMSFNEWHEGSMIEQATSTPPMGQSRT
jgi:hypothetical protein